MSDLYLDNCRHTPNPRSSGNEYPKSIINLESRMWHLAVVSSSGCKSHLKAIFRQFWLILHGCVDPCLGRVVFGASLLPFRGSVRSCNKMGLMSSLLTGGRQLPTFLLPSPAQENHPKQLRTHALYVAPVDGGTSSSGILCFSNLPIHLEMETPP